MCPPIPPSTSRTLQAVGARRPTPGSPARSELVSTLRRLSSSPQAFVSLFDARSIAGERHLLSAWAHLGRGRARGQDRLRDRGAEFALFVAGDDQLPRALAKVGVSEDTEQFVLVAEKPLDPIALLQEFHLVEDPTAYPRSIDVATLERLGITEADRQVIPPEGWEGLVLERVALVDLSAPHAGPGSSKSAPHR
ncbi:MAG: KEOPS complex subunit Cgi121 [Thermoplasmata archaeon]